MSADCKCWVCRTRGYVRGPLHSEPCPNCGPDGGFVCGNREHRNPSPSPAASDPATTPTRSDEE
jgi:hypothetical protein